MSGCAVMVLATSRDARAHGYAVRWGVSDERWIPRCEYCTPARGHALSMSMSMQHVCECSVHSALCVHVANTSTSCARCASKACRAFAF